MDDLVIFEGTSQNSSLILRLKLKLKCSHSFYYFIMSKEYFLHLKDLIFFTVGAVGNRCSQKTQGISTCPCKGNGFL